MTDTLKKIEPDYERRLWDEFAKAALNAYIASDSEGLLGHIDYAEMASNAADAMMAERKMRLDYE